MILAYPHLAAGPLRNGLRVPNLSQPFQLRGEDFAERVQSELFLLLSEHPGESLDSILADDDAREIMDRLVALGAQAEEMRRGELYSSETAVKEAWLRLGILSRQHGKQQAPDYNEKEAIQAEIWDLEEALRAVANEP